MPHNDWMLNPETAADFSDKITIENNDLEQSRDSIRSKRGSSKLALEVNPNALG
jgi:hypothetical protein